MQRNPAEEHEQREFEKKAKAISDHILKSYNSTEKPIKDLNPEELEALVKDDFDKYGLSYILSGSFDTHEVEYEKINLTLITKRAIRSIEEVKENLEHQLERYIESLKKECERYKAHIYKNIRAYQDEQRRGNEKNPFSN